MFTRIASALLVAGLLAATASTAQAQTKKTTTTTKKTTTKPATKAPAKTTTTTKTTTPTKTTTVVQTVVAAVAPLTSTEASAGIKEALNQAITRSVQYASEADGYNLNDDIHIPWPEDAMLMKATLSKFPGMPAVIESFETQLNRAAEAAAPKAKEIFLNALANISITDALTLVSSSSTDAATQFLRKATEAQLVAAFRPDIGTAIDQVGAGNAYKKMTTQYNRIPLMTPVQTDLTAYTTQKAVDGLFILMAKEEAKIRKNPAARTSELLKRVFGTKS